MKDVRVGAYCVIGPGAVVRDVASIGHGCYVGAEAVIGKGGQRGAWSRRGAGPLPSWGRE